MVGVDDQVAGRKRRQFGEEGVGALAAPLAADQPVAEHVLLGQHRDLRRREAVVERQDHQSGVGRGSEGFLPGADLLARLEAMVLEQAGKPFASSGAIAGENDFMLSFLKFGDMTDDYVVDICILCPLGAKSRSRSTPKSMTAASGLMEGQARWSGDRQGPRHSSRDR
jgi:hypothetical protein